MPRNEFNRLMNIRKMMRIKNRGYSLMKKVKFFKFEHSHGSEVVIANFVREAINYYFNYYEDDLQIDDIVEFDGISIKEITGEELIKKRRLYNDELKKVESISYLEIAEKAIQIPLTIDTNY